MPEAEWAASTESAAADAALRLPEPFGITLELAGLIS
jgi:hypothetical protein